MVSGLSSQTSCPKRAVAPSADKKPDRAAGIEDESANTDKGATDSTKTKQCTKRQQNRANHRQTRNVPVTVHRAASEPKQSWSDEREIEIPEGDGCCTNHETNACKMRLLAASNANGEGREQKRQWRKREHNTKCSSRQVRRPFLVCAHLHDGAETPNDPATRPTGRVGCNSDALAGLDAAAIC